MSLSSRVSRLVPDLAATLERFPACVLAAVALCIISNLEAGDITRFDQDTLARIYFAGASAFLAGGAGHMFALGRTWEAMPSAMLGLATGGLAALLCYFYTSTGGHFMFVLPALTLALMVAAYLRRGTSEEALWLFNARLGMAIGLAIVITVIFGGGLSAILASLEYLFEFDLPSSLYEHTWATAAALIGPVYGLSLMPTDLDETAGAGRPAGPARPRHLDPHQLRHGPDCHGLCGDPPSLRRQDRLDMGTAQGPDRHHGPAVRSGRHRDLPDRQTLGRARHGACPLVPRLLVLVHHRAGRIAWRLPCGSGSRTTASRRTATAWC